MFSDFLGNLLVKIFILYILYTAISSGNFTNQGEGLTPRECIGKCCDRKSCDLAFMFADLCYSVECKKEDECQAVVAKPSSLDPKVAYVSRNKWASDREF